MNAYRIITRRNSIGLVILVLAGCASPPAPSTPAGQLPPGTARLSVDGADAATDHRIRCRHEQFWTAVDIGDDMAGVAAVVRNSSALTVESVQIRDVGGFTGSFWTGHEGQASATMNGPTLTVRGTATGFRHDDPSRRVTADFDVTATC